MNPVLDPLMRQSEHGIWIVPGKATEPNPLCFPGMAYEMLVAVSSREAIQLFNPPTWYLNVALSASTKSYRAQFLGKSALLALPLTEQALVRRTVAIANPG